MPFVILALEAIEERVAYGNQAAHAMHRAADFEKAEVEYRALLPWANHRQRAVLLNNLAMLLRDRGRLTEARPLIEESLRIRRELYGEHHPETWVALSNLGSLEGAMGDWKSAGARFRQVLESKINAGADKTDSLVSVALVEKLEGQFRGAIEHLEQAKASVVPTASRTRVSIHNNLGSCLLAIGNRKQARAEFEAALALTEASHPIRAQVLLTIATLDLAERHTALARARVEDAAAIEGRYFDRMHPRTGAREKMLAWIEFGEGHWREAESRLLAIAREDVRNEPDALELRARIALKRKNEEEALGYLERAIAQARQSIGKDASILRNALTLYGQLMRKRARYAEAAQAEQAVITLETRTALASYFSGSASRR